MKQVYNQKYFQSELRDLENPRIIHHGSILIVKDYLKDQKRILDLGCGLGVLAKYLADSGKQVWGVDGSEYALEQAKKYSSHNLSFQLCDLEKEKIPFSDKFFDGLVCIHCLEHLEDLDLILKEVKRVLGKGKAVFVAPNEAKGYQYWAYKHFFKPILKAEKDNTHKHFFTSASLKKLLKKYFKEVKVFTYPAPFIWLISPKWARFFTFDWGNNIFAVCEK